MSWAIWLAVPIGATALAALWSWWRGRRYQNGGAQARLETADAMRAHQTYLDTLTVPARAMQRCVSGMDVVAQDAPASVSAPNFAR